MRIARVETAHGPVLAAAAGDEFRSLGLSGLDELFDAPSRWPAPGPPVGGDLLVPVAPPKIVAVGLNYEDHVRETGREMPTEPLIFAKFPTSVIGPGQPIRIDSELTSRVDWEVELAVVIGRRAKDVDATEALEYVFGYTVANDVSARDLQKSDGQWVRAKSIDTFCPLGPVVVTADEIEDPQNLGLRTIVNGKTMQESSTSQMIFSVAELIAWISRSITLEPGDIILTGTPWGCGSFMTPPRALHPGDELRSEIDGIGTLINPVLDYQLSAS